jgi:hypothetical protein
MQSRHTTVRSVSLDTDLVLWIEEQAAGENRSVSNFVNTLLGRLRARNGPPPPDTRITRVTAAAPATSAGPSEPVSSKQ